MLVDRIIGAFTFKREVYAEVEKDTSFTPMAWGIVVVVAFLNQIAGYLAAQAAAAAAVGLVGGEVAAAVAFSPVNILIGTVVQVAGFALGAYVIMFVGKSMFQAQATFDEVVRTVGLAYVWGSIGIVGGLLAFITPVLVCIASPLLLAAAVLSVISWAIAVHEALDLDWTNTAITVVIAFVVNIVISGVVLGILGVSSALSFGF
ncbi:MAG: YIP1 family protein [Anaerolineales bacterium]